MVFCLGHMNPATAFSIAKGLAGVAGVAGVNVSLGLGLLTLLLSIGLGGPTISQVM